MTTPTVEITQTETPIPLTLNDRCDRCGAAAKVRAIFLAGELLFCGHHGTENKATLQAQGALVIESSE